MARKTKDSASNQTIRVGSELAHMISWICEVEGTNASELVVPLIKAAVTARFEKMKKEVQEIEKIQARLKEKFRKKEEES